MNKIKIGTCVKGEEILTVLPDFIQSGFETIELYFESGLKGANLKELSKKVNYQIRLENLIWKFRALGYM